MKNFKTLCDCLSDFYTRPAGAVAYQRKINDAWEKVGWANYLEQIERVAHGLESIFRVQKTDRVAIMANTRLEWALLDFAIIGLGAVTIPVYPSVTEDDFAAIIESSDAQVIFLETPHQLSKWKNIEKKCPSVKFVVTFFDAPASAKLMSWNEFLEKASTAPTTWRASFQKRLTEANETDLVSIVYTSGTTGVPKGVRLGHRQAISSVSSLKRFGLTDQDVTLSFLPYSHVIGRQELWGHSYFGFCLSFAESIEKLRDNLREVEPTFIVAVPRIFEKFYSAISSKLESNRLSRLISRKATSLGREKVRHLATRTPMSIARGLENILFDHIFYRKIREIFGRNIRMAITGGAPLHTKIMTFFWMAGLPILEGYGLTETMGSITVNSVSDFEFGTVGKPMPDVEIRFGEDKEIFVHSQNVMDGYEKSPEETAKVLHDGWFATGDIGEFTDRGFLKITDRKKDLIKTAGGKFVAPQKLEALVKENDQISQVHIHGDQRKFIIALLTLKNPAKSKDPTLLGDMKAWISEVNSRLASYETIKKFKILDRDFTLEDGELTPSLKIKRKFIDQKYSDVINDLFVG